MTNETAATVTPPAARRRDRCPDVAELRRLLGRGMGVASATQEHLAELVGCSPDAIRGWERGRRRPSRVFVTRLAELESRLRARTVSIDEELARGAPVQAPPPEPQRESTAPLFANLVSVTVEGEQALISLRLMVPGEREPRTVASVLVPKAALAGALAPS